jgi:hypothetical protein
MSSLKPELPEIPESERTALVEALREVIVWQAQRIDELEQEILKLKGETRRPKITPSQMDKNTNPPDELGEDNPEGGGKPTGRPVKKGPKRGKTAQLRIDQEQIVEPAEIPPGCEFKGYRDVVVQDLIINSHNTRYRLAQYQAPEGHYISGQLPEGIRDGHWGETLIGFILYQYHHQHVTQPLLLEQLHDLEVDISSGQLSRFLTEGLAAFHEEKAELLEVGLSVSRYLHTDDTRARHEGHSGYCTHIGNELFAWFESTESKSRVNFLELLSQGTERRYVLNAGAFDYMARQRLPQAIQVRLEDQSVCLHTPADWNKWLDTPHIQGTRHRTILTEAALFGGLLDQGIPTTLSILSDDAGQFNVFDHALCWIHAERVIHRLIPLNDTHRKAVNWARTQVWQLYGDLKRYKLNPTAPQAEEIRARFEEVCRTRTGYETLNQALKRLGKNQHELLRVLDKPWLPLHNNLSEGDIRDYAKKRKISGSIRSEAGRKSRDTFASLKKTCRKHGLSFWRYLRDRLRGEYKIPRLSELIRSAATCG